MARPFAPGRKYRAHSGQFDFVVLGKPEAYLGMPATYRELHVICRIEQHNHDPHNHGISCDPFCKHGEEAVYSHAQLRKHAVLVP